MKWLMLLPSLAYAQITPIDIIPLPEPGTIGLIAIGLVMLIRYGNRR